MKLLSTLLAIAVTTAMASAATVVVSVPRGGSGDQANFRVNSGQTFTTGALGADTLLSSITFVGPSAVVGSDPLGPFTVKIWVDTDGDATTWDPGSLVAASTQTITLAGDNTSVTASFNSGILSDETVYLISFSSGGNDHVAFRMGLSTSEPTGPLGNSGKLFDNMGSPGFGDNRELAFTVTTIPEPASMLLSGIGLLALFRRQRR